MQNSLAFGYYIFGFFIKMSKTLIWSLRFSYRATAIFELMLFAIFNNNFLMLGERHSTYNSIPKLCVFNHVCQAGATILIVLNKNGCLAVKLGVKLA